MFLKKLSTYNISPTPYLLLFEGLDDFGMKNLIRFICLNWQNVAESLQDTCVEFRDKNATYICEFFLCEEKTHRVYFFVEIIHQYFFP